MPSDARFQALSLLLTPDPAAKAGGTLALWNDVRAGRTPVDPAPSWPEPEGLPGRPEAPVLRSALTLRSRSALTLRSRSAFTAEGRATILHAIAHIEFNAINLALDAVWRFAGLPTAYYTDWLRVAAEEAQHFSLLREHLHTLGCDYGHFDAHDGLWQMCERTKHSFRARMALVPRTLEARGLDATPPLQKKLAAGGDARAVAILDTILNDEIGHVAIGNRWYAWACERDGVEPEADFTELCRAHAAPRPRKPLNLGARALAGFTDNEMRLIEAQAQ